MLPVDPLRGSALRGNPGGFREPSANVTGYAAIVGYVFALLSFVSIDLFVLELHMQVNVYTLRLSLKYGDFWQLRKTCDRTCPLFDVLQLRRLFSPSHQSFIFP